MDYEITSPNGKTYVVTAPDEATEDQVLEYAKTEFGKLEKPTFSMEQKQDQPGFLSRYLLNHKGTTPESNNTWGQAAKNVAQGLGKFGTGIVGGLAGDVAGLGATAYDITANAIAHPFSGVDPGSFANPAEVKQKVTNALTYSPENADSLTSNIVDYPGRVIGGAGEFMGAPLEEAGFPNAAHVARAVPLAVAAGMGVKAAMPASITAETPALINGKAGTASAKVAVPEKFVPPKVEGATAQERAENFVRTRTNLDFARLSAEFKRRLTEVAATANNLERLDATAIERQGLLASLEKPITNPTRGQVTRDPLQQRAEQLAKSTEAGAELRDIDIAHNKALTDNLDLLRGRTGATSTGDLQTGNSVQGALRSRLASEKANVRKLYKEAEDAGELQGPANIDKLVEYVSNHDNPKHVSFVRDALKRLGAITEETNGGISVSQAKPLTLKQLEGIRQSAVAEGKALGPASHYAKEVKSVIDEITEGAGGEKYKAAREARKSVGEEFERQAAVARLVKNKKMSSDRATALEDTWHRTVFTGSLDDLKAVRASLEKAGAKGAQAWSDIKAATIDYIKNRATGGEHGLKNQAGDLNATWGGLRRAVDDIGPDKLKELFGEADAKRIESLVEAAQLLKTEAPMGVKGSPTIDKLLTLLDRVGSVPGLGKASELAGGAAKGVKKISEIGKTGREIRRAKTTPLDDAAK